MLSKEELQRLYCDEDKCAAEIAKQQGCKSPTTVCNWLRKYNIPIKRTGGKSNFDDLTGQVFDRLTVEERATEKNSVTKWWCLCKCGKRKAISRNSLLAGLTRSCGCLKKELIWKGHGDLSSSYWQRVTRGAVKRGLELSVTIEDAWSLYLEQDKKCALSGLDLVIVPDYTHKHHLHTASLDRIENDQGYIKGNIQWVHRDLNMMRRVMTIDQFLFYCRKVTEHGSNRT